MRPLLRSCGVLLLSVLAAGDVCKPTGPVLLDEHGRTVWFDTPALVKRAVHCVAPQYPVLTQQVRIQGTVLLDILVDGEGKVACIQFVRGHPLFGPAAVEAAKDWTFRPERQSGKPVSFYGHLRFSFSLQPDAGHSCTSAQHRPPARHSVALACLPASFAEPRP
jgi:TonB family protein